MSTSKQQHKRYYRETHGRSVFDGNPTLVLNRYRTPRAYADAVSQVLAAFHSGTPFNRAVDQISALDPAHLNRNKLAEYTLKTIANDY